MDTKTVEIRPERSGRRPPLLRALEYLLYAVLFVVLVVPPAFIYGLIIKDAANFREYKDTQNFYDDPYFAYGVYGGNYRKIPAGAKFEHTIYTSIGSFTGTYTMMENPAYTFDDGATAALWRRDNDNSLVYVLENGDFLLVLYESDKVDDRQMGTYCTLSDEVSRKISEVVRARMDYDVEESLERIYAATKGRNPVRNYGGSKSVGSEAYITLATDDYVFVGATNFAVDEDGETFFLPDAYLIFDRGTGEQVSIDRFCVGGSFEDIKLELTRRMFAPKDEFLPPYVDYTFTEEDIAEAAAALNPELISFGEDGLRAEIPPGSISAYTEVGFDISARYEALEDLITLEP